MATGVLRARRAAGGAAILAASYQLGDGAPITGAIFLARRADLEDRQELAVMSQAAISSLSIDSDGLPVVGAPDSLLKGDAFRLRFDANSMTWYRVA